MANCKSCRAEIGWAVDTKGKRIPVDAGEKPNGNVAVQEVGPRLYARYLAKGGIPAESERRTTSHFATCPDARAWRERGTAR